MKNELVMKQFLIARNRLVSTLEKLTPEEASRKPEGFNNTIHWHAGHILLIAEKFLFMAPTGSNQVPDHYDTFFANGTKPGDWTDTPPSLAEIIDRLKDQENRFKACEANQIDAALPKPFTLGSGLVMETAGELMNMAIYHEGIHTGYINAMKRIVSQQTTQA
ncbi:DinB family protein [Aneurinibacillus sp. REN35]|uniref:DinB family protein n=1 Tax=Aneurinibacillus sp. REN35 TaxID=3237286 RepID=UPI003527672E